MTSHGHSRHVNVRSLNKVSTRYGLKYRLFLKGTKKLKIIKYDH